MSVDREQIRRNERLRREAEARASWVCEWWMGHPRLGQRGAIPEVRNLCDDVGELLAELKKADRLAAALARIRDNSETWEAVVADEAIAAWEQE